MSLKEKYADIQQGHTNELSTAKSNLADLSDWLNTSEGMGWLLAKFNSKPNYWDQLSRLRSGQSEIFDFFFEDIIPETPQISEIDMLILERHNGKREFAFGKITRGHIYIPKDHQQTYLFNTSSQNLNNVRKLALEEFKNDENFHGNKAEYQMFLLRINYDPSFPAVFIGAKIFSPDEAVKLMGPQQTVVLYKAVEASFEVGV